MQCPTSRKIPSKHTFWTSFCLLCLLGFTSCLSLLRFQIYANALQPQSRSTCAADVYFISQSYWLNETGIIRVCSGEDLSSLWSDLRKPDSKVWWCDGLKKTGTSRIMHTIRIQRMKGFVFKFFANEVTNLG